MADERPEVNVEGMDLSGLTVRQKLYVEYCLSGMSGTKAAREAGYSSPSTASNRLQRHPLVRAAVLCRLKEAKASADAALAQDSEIMKAPWQDYASTDRHGRIVYDYKALIADGYGFCIRGVKETKFGQVVEFEDAAAARERMERHHKLLTDKTTLEVSAGVLTIREVVIERPAPVEAADGDPAEPLSD